jgi:hypothetical protein
MYIYVYIYIYIYIYILTSGTSALHRSRAYRGAAVELDIAVVPCH